MADYGDALKARAARAREDFKRHVDDVKKRQAEWLRRLTKEDVQDVMDILVGREKEAQGDATKSDAADDDDMQL